MMRSEKSAKKPCKLIKIQIGCICSAALKVEAREGREQAPIMSQKWFEVPDITIISAVAPLSRSEVMSVAGVTPSHCKFAICPTCDKVSSLSGVALGDKRVL